jgi:calcineurin-like phosphoesterase family protein
MSKTLFTSDLHFGHVNILEYAPQRRAYLGMKDGDGVVEMNEGLVRLWNSQVDEDDLVFVVGDMAMGRVEENIRYVSRLNGAKCLVMGNHDRPHPMVSKTDEKRKRWENIYLDAGFRTLDREFVYNFDGIDALVNHFPYYGDHSSTRYNADEIARWVPIDEGLPLVHGHVHDLWKVEGKMYNLGIDAWDGVFQTPEAIGGYFRSLGFRD